VRYQTLPIILALTWSAGLTGGISSADPVKYARFQMGEKIAYGIVDGQQIQELRGDFGAWQRTGETHALKQVTLLAPTEPRHVFAMAGNYKSHLSTGIETTTITTTTKVAFDPQAKTTSTTTNTTQTKSFPGDVPKKFQIPQPFLKTPSCLTAHETNILIPDDSQSVVHYEAEMVVVIGREAKNVSKGAALDYVLGVTCGNDVSARTFQKGDVQWWRAKGSDTFGPCGPYIVSGLDVDNLRLRLRHNGQVVQDEMTSEMVHDVATTVSFISQHVTLQPGDLIFTGTPGTTSVIKPGDVIEVELEGVGVLRNPVVAQ